MKIQQLRNATIIVHLGDKRFLVDPMLGEAGSFQGFKRFGGGCTPNPLVELPSGADDLLSQVTDCLITHCQRDHLDHIDPAGIDFIKQQDIPLWSVEDDFEYLQDKDLTPGEFVDGTYGMTVRAVTAKHGHGPEAEMLGPGHGWFISHPDEPSVYLTGDTVLTDTVIDTIRELRPDVIVAPAGCANFGQGEDILFPKEELVELAKIAPGMVVFNHMESLDHCPTTRQALADYLAQNGVADKCLIPADGELLTF